MEIEPRGGKNGSGITELVQLEEKKSKRKSKIKIRNKIKRRRKSKSRIGIPGVAVFS
jgi:hypothetical protein